MANYLLGLVAAVKFWIPSFYQREIGQSLLERVHSRHPAYTISWR